MFPLQVSSSQVSGMGTSIGRFPAVAACDAGLEFASTRIHGALGFPVWS